MITYSDLYEALRKERYNEKLQKLPKNFLVQIEIYFKEKKEMANKDEDGIFADEVTKIKKQVENAKSIVRELLMIRQKKILSLALVAAKIGIDKKDAENMMDYEKQLLESTTSNLEKNTKELNVIFRGIKKKDLKNQLVRFKQDTPKFLTSDQAIGPFKKGDVANLPKEIVEILTKSDQADTVDEK